MVKAEEEAAGPTEAKVTEDRGFVQPSPARPRSERKERNGEIGFVCSFQGYVSVKFK